MLAASSKKNRRLAVVLGTLALGVMIVTVGCGGGRQKTPPSLLRPTWILAHRLELIR